MPSPSLGRALLRRSRRNARMLREHYDSIAHATSSRRSVTPAAEWFVDNYYVVERQLQLIRDDLPSGYYRQLPKLASGELAGLPRIAGIAWAYVAHTDSHLDVPVLVRFVTAYQQVETLTIGELWAIASMLRVVLIENLRRCADRIVSGRAQRDEADRLADRLLGAPTRAPEPAERVLAVYDTKPLPHTLAVQLVQRLRDCDPQVTPALQRVEELLRAQGLTAESVVREELQRQGAANVTVRNIVTSLVQLTALDWSDIVEQLSAVDALLGLECDFYALDFATRNSYRSAIEELARDSGRRETQIAQLALDAARQNKSRSAAGRDPGYYLIGPGRRGLEVSIDYRRPVRQSASGILRQAGIAGYVSILGLGCAAVLACAMPLLPAWPRWQLVLALAFLLFPASEAVVAVLNSAITRIIKPRPLPALDLAGVVPAEHRTLVAIPVLLSSQGELQEMLATLESQYLAGARGELYFALLADGRDADAAVTQTDAALIEAGRAGIAALNRRYGPASTGPRFVWLHRSRRWNAAQQRWMGWERKRGKLHELNRLLRGARDTSYDLSEEERLALPPAVRYVLVLDADTQLPHGAAEKLIAKIAHPLNQPQFDEESGRVTSGYGILQPRVTPALPGAEGASLVQGVLAGSAGLDPYAFAVSDLYQDLFAEGSFTGKGLYDIDAFEKSLAGRIRENSVLSHDLLEGLFARSAVVCDVAVIEPAPDRYDVVSSREHRWARGDWQLLPWLRPLLALPRQQRTRARVSGVGRWKLLDNLRRTLGPPATLAALVVGWCMPASRALWWSAAIVLLLGIPPLLPIFIAVRDRPRHLKRESERHALRHDLRFALLRLVLNLVLLADRAWWMGDAIVRTLIRLAITHRHLLDWTTAAHARMASRLDLASYLRRMRGSVALGVLGIFAMLFLAPQNFWLAAPWLFSWIAAPLLARQISVPQPEAVAALLSVEDATYLRLVARRTWRYFEQFVTPEDHFLPPDNFQETPLPILAQRTSPTNIGMYLLSSVCAFDFGWLGLYDWVERLEATLAALGRLERFRGHLLNWYDTRTNQPLLPSYVSTVDSGNLAGHLLALANAVEAAMRRPLWGAARISGIRDALQLAPRSRVRETLEGALGPEGSGEEPVGPRLRAMLRARAALGPPAPARPLTVLAAASGEEADWAEVALGCAHSHLRDMEGLQPGSTGAREVSSLGDLARLPEATAARDLAQRMGQIAQLARTLADEMDFGFLLKPHRMLLSIGFNVVESRLDDSDYDLLASEARLASFVAIAKRDVPARHWFRLDRRSVALGNLTALLSWSGSMFEYLMPSLVMRPPSGSLLGRAVRVAVRAQRDYAATRHIPWGISESAFNTRDLDRTYQYSPFGVPALGLKRGLANDLVVAPYATGLAAMVDPVAAAANYRLLAELGGLGAFGFYEALDFTPERLAEGDAVAVVRAYMAHHQGMTIVAIANALSGGVVQDYFHAEASTRASELLLQEKPPRSVEAAPEGLETEAREARFPVSAGRRRLQTWRPRTPHTQLLSNGRYAVMVSASGAGFSRCANLAVTRWSEDPTCDRSGQVIYLHDRDSGDVWSGGFAPMQAQPDAYRVTFAEDRVEIARRDGPWATRMQILVSAEHDAEARRISIANQGERAREIEVTSYGEVLLTTAAADRAHRAFSNLFVQTEFDAERRVLLAGRRPRAEGDVPVWAAHFAVIEAEDFGACEYETDRARFLGRDRNLAHPRVLAGAVPLSGSSGSVLDPVFSLRYRLRVGAGETARVTFWTALAGSKADVLRIVDMCRDPSAFDRASTLAWTHARVQLHHLGLDPDEASLFQRLAAHVFYLNPALRAVPDTLRRNRANVQALWAHGISGDRPIMLVEIDDASDLALVRQLLRAHGYFTTKNVPVDLVILNGSSTSYMQELQSAIESLTRAGQAHVPPSGPNGTGSVFALRSEVMSAEARLALLASARVALIARRGTLLEQLDRLEDPGAETAVVGPPVTPSRVARLPDAAAAPELQFANGTGGFTADGREYAIVLRPGQSTPMPWINVIAQPEFGFQVSASGAGFTWSRNSRENALTTWSNDAVIDPPAEALYVRDDDTGELWSPTASPIRDPEGMYRASHGQGYTRFEYTSRGIALELIQFVPRGRALKVSQLRIRNQGAKARRLTVCAYVEWSLGPSRIANAPYIITEQCAQTGALLARNPWNAQFGARTAYLDMGGSQTESTCDRREFLGLQGLLESPAALRARLPLSGRSGAALDPCAALLTAIEIPPGGEREVVTFLGQSEDPAGAITDIFAARNLHLSRALAEVTGNWDELLGKIRVKTPDPALDLLLNRWLPYQTLACRVWARTAFYQSSGAYGFRDQLQDCMALTNLAPTVAREHLLRAAGRQFPEGDLQHWWMPESGKGIRTHISDDRAWLAYCTAHYVAATGDAAVLDEAVPFLEGEPIPPGASDKYFEPRVSERSASVYEHCALALDASLAVGAHGLPLMGGGDWNDGMNLVGAAGRGESIWLAWFLCATLEKFAALALQRGDREREQRWRSHREGLRTALENEGWDGDWYRRGYFDDGTPLGSARNTECRIDSIAQSWAVLSGAANPARAAHAMAAVYEHLARPQEKQLLLFTPAFVDSEPNPGYIRAYPAGIRENGGQYTHGSIWSLIAFARLGDGERAKELFDYFNPIRHSLDAERVERYKLEPYVVAADIYAAPAPAARGGWSWYTGAAGWLYRAGLEAILGLCVQGNELLIQPCIPRSWRRYDVEFRHGGTRYEITVTNPFGATAGISHVELDHVTILRPPIRIPLVDDRAAHSIRVVMG
ncbi:MAG: glycosyl transferase [Proteobacteria bacterium]|nr:glycosyl transferase [Pseudomonadota bacterium]